MEVAVKGPHPSLVPKLRPTCAMRTDCGERFSVFEAEFGKMAHCPRAPPRFEWIWSAHRDSIAAGFPILLSDHE